MELTPQLLAEVTFRERRHGYHPEDVDRFLERVAAGVEELYRRLGAAEERAERAEASLARINESEETLRRTLVLAQRTADAAVAEARQEASRIIAEAAAERDRLLEEARVAAERLREEATAPVREEVSRLERRREELVSEVGELESWLRRHVEIIRAFAGRLGELAGDLEPAALPTLVPAPPPPSGSGEPDAAGDGTTGREEAVADPTGPQAGEPAPRDGDRRDTGGSSGDLPDAGGLRRPDVDGGPPTILLEALGGDGDEGVPAEPALTVFDDDTARDAPAGELDDEAYLEELRRAVAGTALAEADKAGGLRRRRR